MSGPAEHAPPPPPHELSLELSLEELSLEDVLAAALGAAALIVRALEGDDIKALRLASRQCRASVDAAVVGLAVSCGGHQPLAPPPPTAAGRFPALRRLKFYSSGLTVPIAHLEALAAGAFPFLEELSFCDCALDPAEAAALARAAPRLPALRALTFRTGRFTAVAGEALFAAAWPALRAVKFGVRSSDSGVGALAAAWRNLEALARLEVRGHRATAADVRAIAAAGWRLEELVLSIPALRGAELFAALAAAPALRVRALVLPRCRLSSAALRALAAPSCRMRLTALDLEDNPFGDVDAGHALAALAWRHPLRALRLASCRLGTAGVEAVASAEWSALAELDLDFNGADVGELGAAGFARMPKLAALDLAHSGVGPAGAALLAARVGAQLTRLSLRGAWRGDVGAVELAAGAWPALRSVNLGDLGRRGAGAPLGVEDVRRWAPAIRDVFSADADRAFESRHDPEWEAALSLSQ